MALLAQDQAAEMPWDEIDAVVFDVGNVLLRFDPPWLAARSFPGDEALQRAAVSYMNVHKALETRLEAANKEENKRMANYLQR